MSIYYMSISQNIILGLQSQTVLLLPMIKRFRISWTLPIKFSVITASDTSENIQRYLFLQAITVPLATPTYPSRTLRSINLTSLFSIISELQTKNFFFLKNSKSKRWLWRNGFGNWNDIANFIGFNNNREDYIPIMMR